MIAQAELAEDGGAEQIVTGSGTEVEKDLGRRAVVGGKPACCRAVEKGVDIFRIVIVFGAGRI